MSEPILLGIDILLIMVGWHFVVRKTALDTHRDMLFDLRESVRRHYLEKGYGLEHHTYFSLRDLINSQIRFLEKSSLVTLTVWRGECRVNPELRECLNEFYRDRFQTDDKELEAFITKVRFAAYRHTVGYIIYSSSALTMLCYVTFPVVLALVICRRSFHFSRMILNDALYVVIQRFFTKDLIEGVSTIEQKKAGC